ncbi:hypothetical protein RF11_16413 [Thelohanellus kitauei]|uniref:Uncharacterized protein n=1 Tax=Thelohanellus kitauei TaxID=669202 RepID=A0A0C2N1A2_THEKT|nr:hypothetical protein RF11_16413 [Thelohanellus kitauei]
MEDSLRCNSRLYKAEIVAMREEIIFNISILLFFIQILHRVVAVNKHLKSTGHSGRSILIEGIEIHEYCGIKAELGDDTSMINPDNMLMLSQHMLCRGTGEKRITTLWMII